MFLLQADSLSALTIGLIVLAALMFIIIVKNIYRFKRNLRSKMNDLDDKISKIEKQAALVRGALSEVQEEVDEKIDYDYLNKRIDGLISLIKDKKTSSKKAVTAH